MTPHCQDSRAASKTRFGPATHTHTRAQRVRQTVEADATVMRVGGRSSGESRAPAANSELVITHGERERGRQKARRGSGGGDSANLANRGFYLIHIVGCTHDTRKESPGR